MASMCQHMHVMPATGGLLEQDHLFVVTLNWVTAAQQAKEALERDRRQPARR